MQSAPCRSRSRSRPKKLVPGRETTLGAFLRLLHTVGCPSTFLKIVYYVLIQKPINCDDLVDSLEVFSGEANYSKVSFVLHPRSDVRPHFGSFAKLY
jgi:hypothetical protein